MTQSGEKLPELVAIMQRLLSPDGCPWDREQTLETLRPYVVEEAHEVVDAIDRGDMSLLREELGDLLLQIVFQSALAGEHFGVDDVITSICEKMVRRHPHVFGDAQAEDSAAVVRNWEAIKAAEKKDRGVLEGVPVAMPSLLRAVRVSDKAAHLGLEFPDEQSVRAKLDEELGELNQALADGPPEQVEAELGDVLFALTNLARKRGVDPEAALRGTLGRFSDRVRWVETALRERDAALGAASAEELDALWDAAKEALRAPQT